MNFNVGDTVRLKSGGPLMTVKKIEGGQVRCTWFDDKGNPKGMLFEAELLMADDDAGFAIVPPR